ncbi:MAG: hypothetical protein ACI4JB_10290 [Porcipelethomonas sp.]
MKIGGNTAAEVQTFTAAANEIGEMERVWETACRFVGFLDLLDGKSDYASYDAKIQQSSHVFICDFKPLPAGITAENSRMIINGMIFDIMLIDDPMGLGQHYEIFLKFTGGQV